MITAEQFQAAAGERFESGYHLAKIAGRGADAIYLGGYAAECLLKALIVKRTPSSQFQELFAEPLFRTALGHSIPALASYLISQRGESVPADVAITLRRIASRWNPNMRYSSVRRAKKEASEFLDYIEQLAAWVKGRI